MPNQPKTPIRGFRVSDDLYLRAQVKADKLGRTLTDVVVEALEQFVAEDESGV